MSHCGRKKAIEMGLGEEDRTEIVRRGGNFGSTGAQGEQCFPTSCVCCF